MLKLDKYLMYLEPKNQIADVFTKGLHQTAFVNFRKKNIVENISE